MSTPSISSRYENIPLSRIHESPFQVREPGDEDLGTLADDIRANGLLNPLTVRSVPCGDEYELIAGHRRYAACQMIGMDTVPANVVEADDKQAEEMLVSENFARRDLTPVEIGDTVVALSKNGRTPDEIAKICGKSVRWVYRMLQTEKLTPGWRKVCQKYKLSQAVVCQLSRLTERQQDTLADMFSDGPEGQDAYDALMEAEDVPDGFENGGNANEFTLSDRDRPALSTFPWYKMDIDSVPRVECERCQNRSDRYLLDPDEVDATVTRCGDCKCFEKLMKEWFADYMGAACCEARKAANVITEPEPVRMSKSHYHIWDLRENADNNYNVPVFVDDESSYKRGLCLWGMPAQKKGRQEQEKNFPTEAQCKEWAYCMAVRRVWENDVDAYLWSKWDSVETILALSRLIATYGIGVYGISEEVVGDDPYNFRKRLANVRDTDNTAVCRSVFDGIQNSLASMVWMSSGVDAPLVGQKARIEEFADAFMRGYESKISALANELADERWRSVCEAKAAEKAAKKAAKKATKRGAK